MVAAGALGVGFLLAGGVGATARLIFRRGREGETKASARPLPPCRPRLIEQRQPAKLASSPEQLSLTEWLAALKRSFAEFMKDDCMGLSQQIAYSSLLAFFPAVAFSSGRSGSSTSSTTSSNLLDPIAPNGVIKFITGLQQDSQRGTSAAAFMIGFFGAVWAASGAMGSVIKAVNRAYDRPRRARSGRSG